LGHARSGSQLWRCYRVSLSTQIKGAIQRVARDAVAFGQREANFEMSIVADWTDPLEDGSNLEWARALWNAAQPFVLSAGCVNHMTADEPEERLRAAYGPEKYGKLAELKKTYDPDNFFCLNHNIMPATA